MPPTPDPPAWHALPAEQTLDVLRSSSAGLEQAEAARRLARYGPNRLPEPPRRHPLVHFLAQFHNVLIYVLLGAALITGLLRHWIDASVILTVALVNALIGFAQERRAEHAMQAIRRMLAPCAAVRRDNRRQTVAGEQLVPGDVVLLEAGDRVPADLRLLRTHDLQVQEAILTGESAAARKQTAAVSAEAPLGDRTCMAFSGTTVVSGQGIGMVVASGSASEIGRISGLLASVPTLTTPLVTQMATFGRWLTAFILAVAALILVFGYQVLRWPFDELFIVVVGLSVAAIPEGLPATLTITLAVGVQAMARRRAIVRRLPAIETLGAVSVICTDKTGTLTRNEMAVGVVATQGAVFTVDGVGYEPAGQLQRNAFVIDPYDHPVLAELARTAALCNDAELKNADGDWQVEGDPMEGALLAFAGKAGVDAEPARQHWTRTDALPFDPGRKFMATLHHDHEGNACIFVKGAPEALLALCCNERTEDGATQPLNDTHWREHAARIAAEGQRVLALAVRRVSPRHTVLQLPDLSGQLTLLGIVGLSDPPRPEAIEAITQCRHAGIAVKMITGDHATTAAAIGRQVGLGNTERVLTGADLEQMDDAALAAAVLDTDVFARTSPEHKLRLVMALQAHGMTVAMTGDGVNDAPALRRADAGIAMGLKGSEAAKEAAELVLADDNFATIVAAVREGRTVYDNIRKVISWTLPTNAGEATTIILALLLGLSLPITALQILWVNLITAVTLGIALAFEPTEAHTMHRPPRPRDAPLLSGQLVWLIALAALLFMGGVFGIYSYALQRGYPIELARTLAMNTLVVMEIFYLFYIRHLHGTSLTGQALRGTRAVWGAVLTVTAGQFAVTYLPPLQAVFETRAVALADGALVVAIGVVLLALLELEKRLRLSLR
jgi:magnesium-transporting ATPase (P-type)